MNKKVYSMVVILYTIINITALVSFNINNDNLKYKDVNNTISKSNEENEVYNNKDSSLNTEEKHKETNSSEESNGKDKIEDECVTTKDLDKKRTEVDRKRQNQLNEIYETDIGIVNVDEIDFNKYNKEIREKNKVMKVPAEEIINKLTISEKAKIMSICKRLDANDYSEINEFLTYKNERLAVLRTLNVVESKVDEAGVEELKGIFSKYIDMNKVEGN